LLNLYKNLSDTNKKMKTVFIATDFSVASENATKYGIEMASDLGLKIVLFKYLIEDR
jgi:hypothetical protein